ncbi:hypothetical protein EDC56_2990 [Sinobacterium caligoides]|uniref:YcgL domain-containing protein EDC56_2990 n=1 Tax=Sinobacterium caligoides TaxID=933926 RepID=A0A3N2DKX9_9GAMM|nr:hypothetical protein EDC56_2990 [Sinobacterium caligoides]
MLCDVYRLAKKVDAYLYVRRDVGLERVPESLLEITGKLEKSMTLLITPEKKLARMSGEKLLAELEEKGFYLQLPPPQDAEVAAVVAQNNRLNH